MRRSVLLTLLTAATVVVPGAALAPIGVAAASTPAPVVAH